MSRTEVLRGIAAISLLATALTACGSGAQAADTGGGHVPPTTQATAATAAPVPAGGSLDLASATGLCAVLPADRAAAALGEPVDRGSATHSRRAGGDGGARGPGIAAGDRLAAVRVSAGQACAGQACAGQTT
jgi:hypothetical protein